MVSALQKEEGGSLTEAYTLVLDRAAANPKIRWRLPHRAVSSHGRPVSFWTTRPKHHDYTGRLTNGCWYQGFKQRISGRMKWN